VDDGDCLGRVDLRLSYQAIKGGRVPCPLLQVISGNIEILLRVLGFPQEPGEHCLRSLRLRWSCFRLLGAREDKDADDGPIPSQQSGAPDCLLFCSCALLPVTILAVVCYRQVASQLREQSRGHLLRSTKEEGMAVYARLGMIDSELQVLASRKGTESFASLGPDVRAMFNGLASFPGEGGRRLYFGNPVNLPSFTTAERQHLWRGKPCCRPGAVTVECGHAF